MVKDPDRRQVPKRRQKALKDYDGGVQRFHRSLGAIQHAADNAKTVAPSGPSGDAYPRYPSVRVLHDLPETA
jgi:hypothetical protein